MPSLKSFLHKKNYFKVRLKWIPTNHFQVTAHINGTKGTFIMDTGASNTCVGTDRIAHFDLTCQTSDIKAAGAGATEMETFISKDNHIRFGDWKKRGRTIVILDLKHVNQALIDHGTDPVDGIIGADILKKGKAIIDYHKALLFLR